MAETPTTFRRALPLVAVGIALAVAFGTSRALAGESAANSPAALSAKAGALLAARGWQFVPSVATGPTLDAIQLVPLDPNLPSALGWAGTERALGKRVLVPTHLVDGEAYPYGASGLPVNVLAPLPADATNLLSTGLYVEWIP